MDIELKEAELVDQFVKNASENNGNSIIIDATSTSEVVAVPSVDEMAPDWSSLPMDLLIDIAMKLENVEDFMYFSVVCRFWRDISSKMKHQWKGPTVPWLLLAENKTENPNCLRKIFNPSNNKCYNFNLPETFGTKCWGTAYGWVVMFGRDFSVRLFNPITKANILFPSLKTIAHGVKNFDEHNEEEIDWLIGLSFDKVIVFKVSQGDHDEFVIVALHLRCLAFARHEDQYWTVLLNVDDEPNTLIEILGIDNKLFGLYDDGAIRYWNIKDLEAGKAVKPTDFAPSYSKVREIISKHRMVVGTTYLVHLNGDLLMILRAKDEVANSDNEIDEDIGYITLGFKVLRLDLKKENWEQVEDLGGLTLFLGGNFSMSISVRMANSLERDCIYFVDDEYQYLTLIEKFGGHDMGVYDMKGKEIRQFYEGGDVRSPFAPPIWFLLQL